MGELNLPVVGSEGGVGEEDLRLPEPENLAKAVELVSSILASLESVGKEDRPSSKT